MPPQETLESEPWLGPRWAARVHLADLERYFDEIQARDRVRRVTRGASALRMQVTTVTGPLPVLLPSAARGARSEGRSTGTSESTARAIAALVEAHANLYEVMQPTAAASTSVGASNLDSMVERWLNEP